MRECLVREWLGIGDSVHRRVERDLNVRLRSRRFGVKHNDMHFLKVLEQCMQVRQVEPTACVIPALLVGGLSEAARQGKGNTHEFALALKYVQRIHYGVALYRRRGLARAVVVQTAYISTRTT